MAPRGGDGLARLENHEPAPGAGEEVTDRQAGLAATDNRDVETLAGIAGRPVSLVCGLFGRVHACALLRGREDRSGSPGQCRRATATPAGTARHADVAVDRRSSEVRTQRD